MNEWTDPIVVVTSLQVIIAVVLGVFTYNQDRERKWRQRKAFLVAHAKKLDSYPTGGYVIEIHNQGDGEAKHVETLIKGKPISKNNDILKGQNNASTIAPRDWITYRLEDIPSVEVDVSISWTDDTGEISHYEKKLIMY